jgi:hypothetical protein
VFEFDRFTTLRAKGIRNLEMAMLAFDDEYGADNG